MFTNKIKSVLIAGTVALGALVGTAGTASADVRGGIYLDGPGISIGFGERRRDRGFGHRRGWDDGHRWDRPRYRSNRCNPRKAVRKARRKGIRNAHVARVGHRGVIVKGRKWGERVTIGFGRSRHCPVRFVRAR